MHGAHPDTHDSGDASSVTAERLGHATVPITLGHLLARRPGAAAGEATLSAGLVFAEHYELASEQSVPHHDANNLGARRRAQGEADGTPPWIVPDEPWKLMEPLLPAHPRRCR